MSHAPMDYGVDKGSACEELLNSLQMVGALRSHVDAGGQEFLEAIGKRIWRCVLLLEPQRRKLLEKHGGVS